MPARKSTKATAAIKPKAPPEEWGVRRMPSLRADATFASRREAEQYMAGDAAHDSNVLIHLEGGEWVDVVPHALEVIELSYGIGSTESVGRCKSQGCEYYRSLKTGMGDPALSEAHFRIYHHMAEPGDVPAAAGTEALGDAMDALADLERTAASIRKDLADPDERLRAAAWWDDHSQGLSRTARQIEARLQVYIALLQATNTEKAIANYAEGKFDA